MAIKRIISEKLRTELREKNHINEKKIQAKIREMAIEELKKDGKLPENYEDK